MPSEFDTCEHGEDNDFDAMAAGGVGGACVGPNGQLRGRAAIRIPYARSNASATSTPCSTPRTSMSVNDLCNIDDAVGGPSFSIMSRSTSVDRELDPDVQLAAEALESLVNHGLP